MQKAKKFSTSKILEDNLIYRQGKDNSKISEILYKEQKGFCAYTEHYIGRADAKDIEHFNPTLKNTDEDSYNNWFLVKHQWNKEKSTKWNDYQPCLTPISEDFDDRVIYDQGNYRAISENDTEACNLIKLLKLDDILLADERKKYLKRKKEEIGKSGFSAKDFFEILAKADKSQISYLRALDVEFNITIWDILPETE